EAPGSTIALRMAISPTSAANSGLTAADQKVGLFTVPFVLNAVAPSRLVLGFNSLYESANRGDVIDDITPAGATGVQGIAYGGRLGAVDNPDVLYAGVGNKLYVRTIAGN